MPNVGYNHSNTKVFLQVLQGVLSDEIFKIGTPVATQVLESADLLFIWWFRPENKEIILTFATSLIMDRKVIGDCLNLVNLEVYSMFKFMGTVHVDSFDKLTSLYTFELKNLCRQLWSWPFVIHTSSLPLFV